VQQEGVQMLSTTGLITPERVACCKFVQVDNLVLEKEVVVGRPGMLA
jgi:hypothetical protein